MASRRVIYGLIFWAVLLFQTTNDNYLGQFLMCLCIALPLLSIALSLPGMLRCRLELSAAPAVLDRGDRGRWQVGVRTRNLLPLARMRLRAAGENLLTGEKECWRLSLSGVSRRRPVELALSTAHCGLLELRVTRARVCDYLGLFSLPVRLPDPARAVCRPVLAELEPPPVPEGQGTRTSPASPARRGPGDDYDLREYRPGDPMRAVHWKLSSKWDELIVRERSETSVPLPLLTLDRFGTPDHLDALLGRALGLSRALLDAQRPHALLWLDREGQPQLCTVSDEKDFRDLLPDLLGTLAPPAGPALDDHPELIQGPGGPVFRIHMTAEGGDSHG